MAKGSVYEGKSFEEAVRKGLDSLGLSRAEATITVIEEGKGGFLGLGARPFKVSIMRRPGGAVREPEETRERRVSSRKDEPRRGGRGGRDRDRGRDDKGGPRKRDENKRDEPRKEEGQRGPRPVRAEGARAEGGRPEGARAEGGRPEGARAEGGRGESRREGRGEGREGREPRGEGREPRGEGREGRGEGRREGRREERRPVVAADSPAPVAAGVPTEPRGESDADSLERRRRRRGRRGGRGRRREGTPGVAGEPAQFANGSAADHGALEPESAESVEAAEAAFEPRAAYHEEPREMETDHAPVQSYTPAPVERSEPVRHAETAVAVETYGEPAMATNELSDTSRRLTEELLRAMGFEATVTVVAEGNRADVTAEIATNDDLLTGQKGEVRQALQHLLNRFLNRGEGSRYHLQLEINDSWRRRELELETLARSLAEQALSQNAEAVTDYLNSQERRIVHVTLKEDSRVKTFALGTGMVKRVAIAPASFPERTGEEDAG